MTKKECIEKHQRLDDLQRRRTILEKRLNRLEKTINEDINTNRKDRKPSLVERYRNR